MFRSWVCLNWWVDGMRDVLFNLTVLEFKYSILRVGLQLILRVVGVDLGFGGGFGYDLWVLTEFLRG